MMNLLPGREYSYEELARLTKSSVRAVAGRLFRARARLRKLLRSHGADQRRPKHLARNRSFVLISRTASSTECVRRSDAADCTRHQRADSHRQLESTTRSGFMNIYTPPAINVGTTFFPLLASGGMASSRPTANTD